MNLRSLLLLVLIVNSLIANSQDKQYHKLQLGVAAGFYSTFPTEETGSSDMSDFSGETKPLFTGIGIIPINGNLSFQTELSLMRKIYRYKKLVAFPDPEVPVLWGAALNENHLQVPLLLRYQLLKKPVISILAGGAFSFKIKSEQNTMFDYDSPGNIFEASFETGLQIQQPITPWLLVFCQSKYDLMLYRNDIHRINALNGSAGLIFRLPVSKEQALTMDTTVSAQKIGEAASKPPQLGFTVGALRSFPENRKGATTFSVSMIYVFDNSKKLSTETGLTIYQKAFSGTLGNSQWYSGSGSFNSTYLKLPLNIIFTPILSSGFSAVAGIAGSCVISERYTKPLYTEDFTYEITANAGFQYELPLNNTLSFITRAVYEYPLFRNDTYKVQALTGSAGLLFNL